MTDGLFEIRDYHFVGDMDAYREWWTEAMPLLRGRGLDVRGLWYDSGEPARISGADPMELPHGSANVTWIIRWDDLDQREREWGALWDDEGWTACCDRHPGFDGYQHMSVRFMDEAGL